MARVKRKASSKSREQAVPSGRRILISGILGLAILIGAATWYLLPQRNPLSEAGQSLGGPRLQVDKELIDFGAVRFEKMVEARFRLKNVGDQPLRLTIDPQVEAIEGC